MTNAYSVAMRRVWRVLLMAVLLSGGGVGVGCAANRGTIAASVAQGPALAMPPRLELPLERRGGHVLLRTWVNGQRAGLFMVDTGSSLTVVESGLVARLGLKSVGGGTTVGIGGREAFTLRRIEDLAVAARSPTSVRSGEIDDASSGMVLLRLPADPVAELSLLRVFHGLGGGVNGLIGFPAFASMPFTLDLARDRMVLHDAAAFDGSALRRGGEGGARAFPLRRVRGLPAAEAVVVDVMGRETPVLLVIDSGADNALTLPVALLRADPTLAGPSSGAGRSRGVGGDVSGTLGFLPRLRVLGRDLEGVEVSFEPSPEGFDRHIKPVGRIGVKLIERMQLTFDARRGVLWAAWNPGE